MRTLEARELKPYRDHAAQLALLRQRGMAVGNEAAAMHALERLGYYRLSGYFYPLRKPHPSGEPGRRNEFIDGSSLDLVIQLAEFDKKLRLLTLYALETIEIAVRAAVAQHLGRIDVQAHRRPELLDGRFTAVRPGGLSPYAQWLKRFDDACVQSKEDFIRHHRLAYEGHLPIWVAIEVWDFGLLSRFFAGLKFRDKNAIAAAFGLEEGEVLRSWIRTFNFVRNVAAHHARLWNRVNTAIPALPPADRCPWLAPLHKDQAAQRRLFAALTLMRYMLRSAMPHSRWHQQVKEHIATFPRTDLLSLRAAGFPARWQDMPIWD